MGAPRPPQTDHPHDRLHRRFSDIIRSLVGDPARLADLVTTAASTNASLRVVSPLTGAELATVPSCSEADVAWAFARAQAAQRRWQARTVAQRTAFLRPLRELCDHHHDALIDLVCLENGKARRHAQEEVLDITLNAAYLERTAAKTLATTRHIGAVPGLTLTRTQRHPEGVVGVIAPWNYPLTLALSDALAALVAGNAVVLKPASLTPLCALAAKQLLVDAGLDPDLFHVVPGPGSTIGSAVIDRADHVMFTGSSAIGREVAAQAGRRLIPVSAELGGKNPLIVAPDAPLRACVRGTLAACFASSGQLCVSIERIYVHTSIWDRYVPALAEAVSSLRVAADLSWDADMGPLISSDHLAEVHAHVEDALAKGARLLVGGRALSDVSPTAYAPTLLTDVPPSAHVFREETFGPVVSLYRVDTLKEAVRAANDTPYGLNAAVWGRPRTARQVASRLRAGSVNINDGYTATWGSTGAPLGGWGDSGLGCRHGRDGLLAFTRPRTLARSRVWPLTPPPGLSHRAWAGLMRRFTAAKQKGPQS